MTKRVNALKARKNLGQLLEEVYYKGDQDVIERAGRPMAAVVPVWQLEEWQKRRERFFGMVEEVRQRNKKVKPQVVEREVQEAVRAVRAKARRRRHRWQPERMRVFVDDLAHLAILTPGERRVNVIAEDPSDNRYLECAIEGDADYIVSGDEHLLRLDAYQKIRILTPRAFLDILKKHRSYETPAGVSQSLGQTAIQTVPAPTSQSGTGS